MKNIFYDIFSETGLKKLMLFMSRNAKSGQIKEQLTMNNSDMNNGLPRWDLTAIYSGLDDTSYKNDKKRLADSFQEALDAVKKGEGASDDDTQWIKEAVKKIEYAGSLYENLYSFCYAPLFCEYCGLISA